jgi:hypothetical protein
MKSINLRGVRVHNLKNVDVSIPLHKLTVLTGVSGSGKSSLAFDTLYAEGQRRYIESFSTYARQFLDPLEKPDADVIENLPPAIAIRQNASGASSKATIATATELHDYLRLLFAKVGRIASSARNAVRKFAAIRPRLCWKPCTDLRRGRDFRCAFPLNSRQMTPTLLSLAATRRLCGEQRTSPKTPSRCETMSVRESRSCTRKGSPAQSPAERVGILRNHRRRII